MKIYYMDANGDSFVIKGETHWMVSVDSIISELDICTH